MKKFLGFPKNVFFLGLVSLFMDISSEMIYPLIPIFLSNVLAASKTSIGLIEGVAESTSSLLKVFSGWMSDKAGKRKPLIFWGYSVSVLSRPILALASSWPLVLLYRFADRAGKGIRTAPRDAMLAESAEEKTLGRSFGFHRAMDTTGAVIGPLLAFTLLAVFSNNLRAVFWASVIPGLLAVMAIAFFVKETKRHLPSGAPPSLSLSGLDGRFKAFVLVAGVFTLGKTSEAFLVLRALDIGVPVSSIPLVYLLFNLVAAALSTHMGSFADRAGMKKTIFSSYVLFALIFLGFAHASSSVHIWGLFISYGVFVSLNEGVQRAYVSTLIGPGMKSTGFGVYHMAVGLAALPSAIIGGALWEEIGPVALFYYGASMAILASLLFALLLGRRHFKSRPL